MIGVGGFAFPARSGRLAPTIKGASLSAPEARQRSLTSFWPHQDPIFVIYVDRYSIRHPDSAVTKTRSRNFWGVRSQVLTGELKGLPRSRPRPYRSHWRLGTRTPSILRKNRPNSDRFFSSK
ncbi:hypothetical protein BHE74_00012060 [Ensete ventricosum]|nr:hypothetical protein BHE74_00012060 [Ensete ventricosum]